MFALNELSVKKSLLTTTVITAIVFVIMLISFLNYKNGTLNLTSLFGEVTEKVTSSIQKVQKINQTEIKDVFIKIETVSQKIKMNLDTVEMIDTIKPLIQEGIDSEAVGSDLFEVIEGFTEEVKDFGAYPHYKDSFDKISNITETLKTAPTKSNIQELMVQIDMLYAAIFANIIMNSNKELTNKLLENHQLGNQAKEMLNESLQGMDLADKEMTSANSR